MGEQNDERRQNGADRRHVGADREHPSRQEDRPGSDRGGQPPLRRGGARAVPHGIAVARPSGALRKVEQRLQAVPPLDAFRGFQSFVGRVRASSTCSSTARSSRRTRRRRAQKGGRKTGNRAFPGWPDQQGSWRSWTRWAIPCGSRSFPARRTTSGACRELLDGLRFGTLAGDRASGADWLLEDLEGRGAEAVIPSRRNRTEPREHDREKYGWRHRVENFFARIKEFRAIATRYDKTATSFAAGIHLIAGVAAAS